MFGWLCFLAKCVFLLGVSVCERGILDACDSWCGTARYSKSINDAGTMMLLWYSKVQQEHLRCYVSGEVGSWVSSLPPGDGPLYLTGNISYCANWNFFWWSRKFFLVSIHTQYLPLSSESEMLFVTSFTKRSWLMFQLLVWNLAKALHFNECIFICHPSQLLLTRGVGGNTSSTIVPLYRYHCHNTIVPAGKVGKCGSRKKISRLTQGGIYSSNEGDYRAIAFFVCSSYEPKSISVHRLFAK